jgi:hypothetical protein
VSGRLVKLLEELQVGAAIADTREEHMVVAVDRQVGRTYTYGPFPSEVDAVVAAERLRGRYVLEGTTDITITVAMHNGRNV